MIRSISATELKEGDVLALPMGKTATASQVNAGIKFVSFKTEFGTTRVERYSEILVEVDEDAEAAKKRIDDEIWGR